MQKISSQNCSFVGSDAESYSRAYTFSLLVQIYSAKHAVSIKASHNNGNATKIRDDEESGQRVRKVVEKNGITETRLYFGGFEIFRKKDSSGALILERETLHVMDDVKRIALVETLTVDNGSKIANPVSVQRYQLGNNVESATLELDENAQIISYEEYYPYGDTSYQAGRSAAEVSQKRYRYTGKEKDEESGLYYMLARYYSGWLGRWTAADPVGLVDGVNLYAYCRGNPVKYIDPDGKEIRLEGTEEEKKATFKNLQKLTNDELSMSFNKEDSTSTVIIKKTGGANTGKDLKLGSELIQELIQLGDGAKTVTIKQVKGEKKNYAYIADDSKEADAENGTGTNAIIDFNLASADVLVEDPDTGELFTETMAPHIVLAHELIHAYNINKGTRLPDKKVDHTYNTPYGRETENEKLGELNTVGVSGYDKNKYTENKIRAEQGQYTRRAYGWKDERLKGESLKNERLGAVLVRRIKGASEWIKKLF